MPEEPKMSGLAGLYRRQFHLLWRWSGGWPQLLLRAVVVVTASLAAFAFTAWYIPGLSVAQPWEAAAVAAALAAISALVRPLLGALLSRISVLLVGLATLIVQAVALVAVARVVPGIGIDRPTTALLASVLYSVSHALIAASLSLANDTSFFGTLVRQLAARDRAPRETSAGVIFLQIDGLAHSAFLRAIARGDVPTLARWSRSPDMTLDRWEPLLPTQTSASQAGILHGNNDGIPAFRWWEKSTGRLLVSNHPRDAREILRRVSDGHGLLTGGASIANLLSGDARRSFLTASTVDDPAREAQRSHVLDWFLVSPYAFVRWIVLSVGEIATEIVQAQRERITPDVPRGARAFPYPLARAATNVILRHLVGALVIEEMYQRTPVIYADFVDYDEIAHHAGIERLESRRALRGIDRIIALLERAALDAPRPYRFVVLSDHGQTPGPMFRQRTGRKLEEVIAGLMGGDVDVHAATTPAERTGRVSLLDAGALGTRLLPGALPGGRKDGEEPPELVVAASGNLAQVSLARMPGRVTREALEERYPGLVARLAAEPGIGLVMVRSAGGPLVVGRAGTRSLDDGTVDGADPLAPYGANASAGLRRVDAMPNCGDLVVIAEYDPSTGETCAFEDQVGSHGGLGGAQGDAFILHPATWPLGHVVGAPELHARLCAWLGEGAR
ncbi:MAG TPA: phage holin family protein [Candidatus Acidoferrales bacterium]|nr:phage holin family protein [Candidatus Acidoferrales bacterium]